MVLFTAESESTYRGYIFLKNTYLENTFLQNLTPQMWILCGFSIRLSQKSRVYAAFMAPFLQPQDIVVVPPVNKTPLFASETSPGLIVPVPPPPSPTGVTVW